MFHGAVAGANRPSTLGEFRARVVFLEREVGERDRQIEALLRQVSEQKAQIEKLIAVRAHVLWQ